MRSDPFRPASGHTELVSLRVAHDNRIAAYVGGAPGDDAAGLEKAHHVFLDELGALVGGRAGFGGADVEVDPVLGGFAFGYPLNVDAGAGAGGVDDRGLIAELFLGHADGPAEVFPGGEAFRWWLGDVAQGQFPERGELRRFGRVEYHLDLRVHGGPFGS